MILSEKINWIFFDLDGTLADSIPAMYKVYIDFLTHFGLASTRKEFKELNGLSLPEIITALKTKYGLADDENQLLSLYKGKILNAYKNFVQPLDGAGMVLKELKDRKYKLLLVTSAEQDVAIEFIKHQKWNLYFQNYVFGGETKKAKPDSDIYVLALRKANASSDSVVIIEDSCNGIKSAKATGAFIIGITNNHTKEELLKTGADITISHLREIVSVLRVKA